MSIPIVRPSRKALPVAESFDHKGAMVNLRSCDLGALGEMQLEVKSELGMAELKLRSINAEIRRRGS